MEKILYAGAFLLVGLPSAIAQIVVAQYEPGGALPVATFAGTSVPYAGHSAQTFTASAGGQLFSAELWMSRFQSDPVPTNIVVEFRTTTGGIPDAGGGAIVATASVAGSSLPVYGSPSYVNFDFSGSGFSLISGNIYALDVYGSGGTGWAAWMGNTDDYTDGALYHWNGSSFAIATPSSLDARFRVSVTAIPEPSTCAVLLGSFALGLLVVRKRLLSAA